MNSCRLTRVQLLLALSYANLSGIPIFGDVSWTGYNNFGCLCCGLDFGEHFIKLLKAELRGHSESARIYILCWGRM
jgi:hypothetical protein